MKINIQLITAAVLSIGALFGIDYVYKQKK